MNYLKSVLLISGLFLHFTSYCQSDTIIKAGFVNIATLIVDYDTYEFEGYNMSYYTCPDCNNDSIPFLIDYDSPGDFGGVTLKLAPTSDTIFDATIVWSGTGQIYYPNEFNSPPFNYMESTISEPTDTRYIDTDGGVLDDAYLLEKAQLVWNSVDSLEITKLFSDKGLKVGIYLYPPTVGAFDPTVAKWIVFLYYNDISTSIDFHQKDIYNISLYPNPVENFLNIKQAIIKDEVANYRIYSSSGTIIMEGRITEQDQQIDLSSFTGGLYYVDLTDSMGNLIVSEKFIKK